MKYPKTYPKSDLTLSAGQQVRWWDPCSPDDFPPYDRVPPAQVRVLIGSPLTKSESVFISHTIAWIVFGLLCANIFIQLFRP